jgi:hypothetical protein
MTVEVDTANAEARTVTVEGRLRASRAVPSRLTVYGNLVVRGNGVLDYGTPRDRVLTSAVIRFVLDEARYVGGPAMEPVASDVGLWAVDRAQVWVHGDYRDTWSPLQATAAAGSNIVEVDPSYSRGWRVGDELLLTGTNRRGAQETERPQDERRLIAAVLGPGRFQLDRPLTYAHVVLRVPWTDAWGDAWTEVLAGKVANLTSNVRFEAADSNHRPHVMFMNQAKAFVEDLAVRHFSPRPRFLGFNREAPIAMGRYAWHHHIQADGSRGSYLRRLRLLDGPGDGLHLHESFGIAVEDLVVWNHARVAYRDGASGAVVRADAPLMLEVTPYTYWRDPADPEQYHAADGCWIDRALIVGGGMWDAPYNLHGIWVVGSRDCAILNPVVAGMHNSSASGGIEWVSGLASGREVAHVFRAEAFSNRGNGIHSWMNNTPRQDIVDMLTWHNGTGLAWGAYRTEFWGYQVRSLYNRNAQLLHWAAGWGLTGFLAVGGAVGVEIGRYGGHSERDSVYQAGVVRDVDVLVRHSQTSDVGQLAWVQLADVTWDGGRPARFFESPAHPPGSRVRMRRQQGLPRPQNFTLWRNGDPNAPSAAQWDAALNALRLDNDGAGTLARAPRVRMVTPDDQVAAGPVTLTVETDASEVVFYQAHRVIARVPVAGQVAQVTFDMRNHPHRRAYFWARAERNGVTSASRVIRVRKP